MAFILVSVPVFASASQLTGIPIPQGNVLQQLVTGQSYSVTCTGAGVYFRGWTGSGGGSSLQNNCGAGFSQNLSPAVYQFSVQDNSGFNTIETFNVLGTDLAVSLNGYLFDPVSPQFIGYTSDSAFSSITLSEITGAGTIDNFSFGALAGATDVGVPEPATMTLFGMGLAALGIARRRRHV